MPTGDTSLEKAVNVWGFFCIGQYRLARFEKYQLREHSKAEEWRNLIRTISDEYIIITTILTVDPD